MAAKRISPPQSDFAGFRLGDPKAPTPAAKGRSTPADFFCLKRFFVSFESVGHASGLLFMLHCNIGVSLCGPVPCHRVRRRRSTSFPGILQIFLTKPKAIGLRRFCEYVE
ncbi:hypothetical protein [Amorphus orientalis]|uniref:Uncharacterized protein n=1 Tax=Amorphus orientalis TaxID=649198 RepID=A0AAE3VSX6_9HYPH|nr:hypothetical protein [Amorphus orientalis]MDQ0317600.1 hypothetical protein [Amorphus orientalis]